MHKMILSSVFLRNYYEISELTLDEDMGRVREEIKNNSNLTDTFVKELHSKKIKDLLKSTEY